MISTLRCVWLGLELNYAGVGPHLRMPGLNPKNYHAVEKCISKSLVVAYILMSFYIEKYVHFLLFDRDLESKMFWVISGLGKPSVLFYWLTAYYPLTSHPSRLDLLSKATNQLMPIPQIWLSNYRIHFVRSQSFSFKLNTKSTDLAYLLLRSTIGHRITFFIN